MRSFLLAALLLTASPAFACETWGGITLGSKHGGSEEYRESNLGLNFQHRCGRWGVGGGFYRNSFDRTSVHFGGDVRLLEFGSLKFRLMGVVASGYAEKAGVVAVPVISWEGKDYGLDVLVVPPIGKHQWVIGYGVKFRF